MPVRPGAILLVCALGFAGTAAGAEVQGQAPAAGDPERIQVTATRVPEDVESVPTSITVIDGDEIRARGAADLAGALALAAGVAVAPGGDGGPASSVPEIWGLREFDAFLLVVDGIPWGGAFNPDLASLNLNGVARIEVLRGAAPVMFGATSFVGVIQVIHEEAGSGASVVRLSGGSFSSGGAAATIPLAGAGRIIHSLTADVLRQGFRDDRTLLGRGHLLYRAALGTPRGRFHFDLDGTSLRQDPASPHPREGPALSSLVPLDANHNPRDARLDEDRFHLAGGYEGRLDRGTWAITLALTDSEQKTARGFLTDLSGASPDAQGFKQDLSLLDLYFDAHVALRLRSSLNLVAGLDHLYGRGRQKGDLFDYFVPLDGSNPPALDSLSSAGSYGSRDRRNFSGLYAQAEWTPHARLRCDLGARLNRTGERRVVTGLTPDGEAERVTRGSGALGLSWLAWSRSANGLWLFGDFRSTFKPAAADFGPAPEADLLSPETARSGEVGIKGRHLAGRLAWQLSAFQNDFSNLVVSQSVGGLPSLANAGAERFRGLEIEGVLRLRSDLHLRVGGSLHDARFRDFIRDFGGVPTQLEGNRLEMSARTLASFGLVRAPARGFVGSLTVNHTGSRYLNQRNTALAQPFTAWDAGVGYRTAGSEVRLDARNLGATRPPVSESELGDAQYYLLPDRSLEASWVRRY
ncbi:MAG TPA: TonB-dependent receptor [Candidatus Polarisedimenticolia bacterium]|nr:TonB-dependent receptor [Candidatus Polarisedimenticolia bacterium]